MKRILPLAGVLLLLNFPLFGEETPFSAAYSLALTAENLGIHRDIFYEENQASLSYTGGPFLFNMDFSFMGGRRYPAHSSFQLDRYFYINDASLGYSLGNLYLYGGYAPHHDVVATPYSIYISSMDIPSLNAGFTWNTERFFYETRWVRINERSAVEYVGKSERYRDRGLTFKAIGLTFGNLTIGFEDAYMYLDQSFDAESFLSPVPMYLFEMMLASGGRPWSQSNNVNALMGFFAEWESKRLYVQSQLLIDDINASIFAPLLGNLIPSLNEIENLSKLAWNVGGRWQLPAGSLGFYHGGATKYTFGATYTSPTNYSTVPYEYTYTPATEYEYPAGELTAVPYIDNYIGFKYGENNISFLVDYTTSVFPHSPWASEVSASLEWAINGAKSPANPWHQYDSWLEIDPAVELLTDEFLEHILKARIEMILPWRSFDFSLSLLLGYVWNRLGLEELVANEPKIYVPQHGDNGLLFSVSLRGKYGIEF